MLDRMKLGHDDDYAEQLGSEIPGMIAIYLVQLPDGKFYAEHETGESKPVKNWSEAKFYFLARGLAEAREAAYIWGGRVCIVNCTQVLPYPPNQG